MQYTSYNIHYTCYTIYNDLIHRNDEDAANLATTMGVQYNTHYAIYIIHYTLYIIYYIIYIIQYTMTLYTSRKTLRT